MSLLDDVSIVVTPNGYKAGELYAVVPEPTEGAEQVTNGDFATDSDWIKGTGWTISGGTANCNNTSGSTQDLKTENRILNLGGKTVKIEFTVSNYSGSASMIVTLQGTGGNDFTGINANGTYTAYASVQLSENSIDLLFKASNGWIGSIDNVSVKEYTSADMDVTRTTAGTRVDEDGLVNYAEVVGDELVTNGDFATDSDWSVTQSGNDTITIENGYALFNCPDNSNIYISQGGLLTIGKTYIASVDLLSIDSGSLQFAQGGGGTITGSPSINTLGTHTFTFIAATATFAVKRKLGAPNLLNAKIDNVSVKEVTRDNVPRIDYTGGGCPHILSEPQRTNNLQSTQDFTDTFWNTNNMETIVASTVLSPDGTTFGFKAIPNNTTNKHYVDYDFGFLSMPSGVEATYSVFVKPFGYTNFQLASSTSFASRYQNFELTGDGVIGTGDVNSAKIEKIGDWYRCSITETTTGTTPRVLNIATPSSGLGRNPTWLGNGTDGVLLWGAQMEEGTYSTSYIPNLSTTSGSTVTRNQDQFTRDGIGSLINSTEGVLFVEMAALSNDGTNRDISISDGTLSNRIFVFYSTSSNQVRVEGKVGNVVQFSFTESISNATNFIKLAIKYKENDFALWIDGVEVGTDNSGITFPVNTLDELQFAVGGTSARFFGKVRQLQVYKRALTDEQLTSLTS